MANFKYGFCHPRAHRSLTGKRHVSHAADFAGLDRTKLITNPLLLSRFHLAQGPTQVGLPGSARLRRRRNELGSAGNHIEDLNILSRDASRVSNHDLKVGGLIDLDFTWCHFFDRQRRRLKPFEFTVARSIGSLGIQTQVGRCWIPKRAPRSRVANWCDSRPRWG